MGWLLGYRSKRGLMVYWYGLDFVYVELGCAEIGDVTVVLEVVDGCL